MMTDVRVMSIDELNAFLASSDVFAFKGNLREEIYAWIESTLQHAMDAHLDLRFTNS